jgi:diphthamide synthase subunit DPH2
MTTQQMIDFVEQLKQIAEMTDDFNFSILVEQKPIQKKYTYVSKVLSIILKANSKRIVIHYDQIQEHELTYIEIKDNKHSRKVGVRNTPFFIDGNSKIQTFKGSDYIEYSLRNPTRTDLKFIEKVREKFNIPAPHNFVGDKLTFCENDFL